MDHRVVAKRGMVASGVVLLAIALAWLSACVPVPAVTPDENIVQEPVQWSIDYDDEWAAVTKCWKAYPPQPNVIVRTDCRDKYAAQDFYDEWGRWVHGYFLAPNTVVVCPDLKALRHELSEYTCFTLSGEYCRNTRGVCFDVRGN